MVALGAVLIASAAVATPPSGFSAETARGPLVDRPLAINWKFALGTRIKVQTKGAIEIANQRIAIEPGGTLGWHSHPGPTVVTVLRGTLSFYHAEHCTQEIEYGPGMSFSDMPDEIHLARNEGTQRDGVVRVLLGSAPDAAGGAPDRPALSGARLPASVARTGVGRRPRRPTPRTPPNRQVAMSEGGASVRLSPSTCLVRGEKGEQNGC